MMESVDVRILNNWQRSAREAHNDLSRIVARMMGAEPDLVACSEASIG